MRLLDGGGGPSETGVDRMERIFISPLLLGLQPSVKANDSVRGEWTPSCPVSFSPPGSGSDYGNESWKEPSLRDNWCSAALLHRLAVYSPGDGGFPDSLAGTLPPWVLVDVASTRDQLGGFLSGAQTVVIHLRTLSGSDALWLSAISERNPLTHFFLALDLSLENLERCDKLDSHIFTFWNAPLPQLSQVLQESLCTSLLKMFYDTFCSSREAPDMVVRAMEVVCCGRIIPVTVSGLARRLQVVPKTFRRHWRRYVPETVSLKEFLDWALVVRMVYMAAERGCGQPCLQEVERTLRVSRRTLRRLPSRCIGLTLAECIAQPGAAYRFLRDRAVRIL